MNRLAWLFAVTACLSLLGLPFDAVAQRQAGGDGRALDANPRVGSGGTNALEGQVDYSARNDMVTGDVAGGRGLRIEQPYRAANEFGDALGSDDLFDFRAQSLPSAPSQLNAVQRPVNLGGGTSVYRSYSTTPTILGDRFGSQRIVAPQGGHITADQLVGSDLLMQRGMESARQPYDPLGVMTGRALEATVTPLLGVRPVDFEQLRAGLPGSGASPWSLEEAEADLVDPRQDTRLEVPEYRPLLDAAGPTGEDPAALPDGQATSPQRDQSTSPTMLMGRQLQSRLGAERGDRLDPMVTQRINRLGENLMNQAATRTAAGLDSPYANVLDAVQQDSQAGPRQRTDRRAGIDLGTMDETRTQQAERQRAQALDRAYGSAAPGQPQPQTQTPGNAGEPPAGEASADPAAPGHTDPLAGLLERLNYDLPPLETLAGEQATQVNQLLKQAESALAAGQYFDAERLYRQVVQRRPDDPMPRVGLVHAQLGAGMIRSAALNLRAMFEEHPEMIAARYQANLLPAEQRLRWVRGELEKALEAGQSGSEPALLLAYLGYQVQSRQLVRYGLATAEARAPRDPLMPVLRHIWLDQSENSSDSAQ